MGKLIGVLGLFTMIGIAVLISNNRKKINPRIILGGLGLQLALALFLLKTTIGVEIFEGAQAAVLTVIALSDKGAQFVFGENFKEHFFAFSVLPTIIFVSAISASASWLVVLGTFAAVGSAP